MVGPIEIQGKESIQGAADALTAKRQGLRKELRLLLWRSLTLIQAAAIQNIRTKFKVGTGTLINSIGISVEERGDELIGVIGTKGALYAAIHEFGGTILPKKAAHLWIPAEAIRGPDGVARMSPSEYYAFPKSMRVIKRLPKGGYLAGLKDAPGSETFTPLFWLKDSIEIPARPYLRPALEDNRERIEQKFGIFLQEYFDISQKPS